MTSAAIEVIATVKAQTHDRESIRNVGRSSRDVVVVVGFLTVLALVIVCLLPGVGSGPIAKRSVCKNNLTFIGIALHSYHDEYDSLPPAYVVNDEGKPLYSWRVLILPFLDRQSLYRQLHLDEPWDSPHNRPLLDVNLFDLQCPTELTTEAESVETPSTRTTSYLAVVGPGTVWPAPEACRFDDVADGLSQTVAVVEVANGGIHWAEPRDLHVTQMSPNVNPKAGMGLSSRHEGGANVLFCDGRVHFIPNDTPPETIRALLSRAGGEDVGDDY